MAHELIRLRESLVNTPHLIHPVTFKTVLDYLNARNENPAVMFDEDDDEDSIDRHNSRYSYNEDSKVALLNIEGPLTYRPIRTLCGDYSGTSYQTLKEDFTTLAQAGAKTIALYVNSGGGQAYQMMPTARYLRGVADEYGIKIIAMVDGLSASAAYGLTSIADEIIMAEGSEVGSVGVLIQLMNDSEYLKKIGVERTFIYAGDDKIPFDENGKWTKSFINELQESVDELYEQFTSFVAENRNLTQKQVIDTQARTFSPEKALQLGLVDKVMTIEEFYDYLADEAEANMKGENSLLKNKLFNKPLDNAQAQLEVQEKMKLEELQAQLQTVQTELADMTSKFTELFTNHEAAVALHAEEKSKLEAALAEVTEQLSTIEQEKVEMKTNARKASLSKFVPEETASDLVETLASLDDAAFSKVVAGYELKHVQSQSSELFEEAGDAGVQAHVDEQVNASSDLVQRIKQSTLQYI